MIQENNLNLPKEYTIDDILQVWQLSHHAGVTMSTVAHNNIQKKARQERLDKAQKELYEMVKTEQHLKDLLSSRALYLGVITELLELKTLK